MVKPPMLTVKDVAARLAVSTIRVRRMLHAGELRASPRRRRWGHGRPHAAGRAAPRHRPEGAVAGR